MKRPTGGISDSAGPPRRRRQCDGSSQALGATEGGKSAGLERLKHRSVQLHPNGVTLRRLLQTRRLCRVLLSEAPEAPSVQRPDIGTRLTAPATGPVNRREGGHR